MAITIGIDLATEAKNTGMAIIDWSSRGAKVSFPHGPLHDDFIVETCAEHAAIIAIDCPFGWPAPFIDFITSHRAGATEALLDRNTYRLRATDIWVRQQLKKLKQEGTISRSVTPLSVSTDKLGSTALRCAELLRRLSMQSDRARSIDIIEVYPAASLAVWDHDVRDGWSSFIEAFDLRGDGLDTAISHQRDAVVCAVTARHFHDLNTYTADQEAVTSADGFTFDGITFNLAAAATEGWIQLPRPGSEPLPRTTMQTTNECRPTD